MKKNHIKAAIKAVSLLFLFSFVGPTASLAGGPPPIIGPITPTSVIANTLTTFSATYSDTDAVIVCNFIADGVFIGGMELSGGQNTGTALHTFAFATVGSHSLQIRCQDTEGNTALSPVTTISAVGDSTAPSTPTNVALLSIDSRNLVAIGWDASVDNVNIGNYQVSVDGKMYTRIGKVTSYTTSALDKGVHTIAVRAEDTSGNTSAVASISVTVLNAISHASSSFTLDSMSTEAGVLANISSNRAALEVSNGVPCEVPSATATSRVNVMLGNRVASSAVRQVIQNFMACGTPASFHLGSGERLGVINSYYASFGRWPSSQAQWFDVLKIANGRFPTETSATAETRAKANFRKVYYRDAKTDVAGDNNAVTVMAYGLRPLPRNTNSETSATASFRYVYGHTPTSASDWDIVRAIAYSGATR